MSLLLIAHGSPDPRHSQAMQVLAGQVAAASRSAVQVGHLEYDAPLMADVLATHPASATCGESWQAVGLFLTEGYHARVDVPSVLAEARTSVVDCGTIGLGPWIVDALEDALTQRVGRLANDVGVALVAAGSNRPEARDAVQTLAATWQRNRGGTVRAAFASGPGTSIEEALRVLTDAGSSQTVIALLMLAPGVLADRVIDVAVERGIPVTDPLLIAADGGPAPQIVARIVELAATPEFVSGLGRSCGPG